MKRQDFPIFKNKKEMIYFDNAATTLKPYCVTKAVSDYFDYYTANIHRGTYDAAIVSDYLYDDTRKLVKKLVLCNSPKEVIFTIFIHNLPLLSINL